MRGFLIGLVCGAGLLLAQEHGPSGAAKAGEHARAEGGHADEHGDPFIWWKWANFAILGGGLGYLLAKHLPPFFRSRTEEIQKGITEAAALKKDAEARLADMDARLKRLDREIAGLREGARAEIAAEGERMQGETRAALAKIQANAEQEIAAATRAASAQLRAEAAQLAVNLAAERIQARMTPETQADLVSRFVGTLETKRLQN